MNSKASYILSALIILGVLSATGLRAQKDSLALGYSPSEMSRLKLGVFRSLDQLQQNAPVESRIQIARFRRLFSADTVKVANDIIPSNQLSHPTLLKDYLNTYMFADVKEGFVIIHSLRPYDLAVIESSPTGELLFQVKLLKDWTLYSLDQEAFRDSFDLSYYIRYNPRDTSYKFTRMEHNQERGYYLKLRLGEKLLQSSQESELYRVNNRTQRIAPEGLLLKDVNHQDLIRVEPLSRDYLGSFTLVFDSLKAGKNARYDGDYPLLSFRPKRWYLQAEMQWSQFSSSASLISNQDDYATQESIGLNSYGFNIGYRLRNSPLWKWDLSSHFGLMSATHELQMTDYQSSYAHTDADGSEYTHETRLRNIEEESQWQALSLGGALHLHRQIGDNMGLQLKAGYRHGIINNSSYSSSASAQHQGHYEFSVGSETIAVSVYDDDELGFGKYNQSATGELNNLEGFQHILIGLSYDYQLTKRLSILALIDFNQMGMRLGEKQPHLSDNREHLLSQYSVKTEMNWRFFSYGLSIMYYL